MKQTLEAIYENGVFRPLKNVDISEGQQVQLVVEIKVDKTSEAMLQLAAQVYQGLSAEQIDEIEKIALDTQDFFGEKI